MSYTRTLILGAIAGLTILLGLPIGRLRRPAPRMSQFLNALTVGILFFLAWDVLAHAWEPIDEALAAVHDKTGGLGRVFGYGTLFFAGLGVGLVGLAHYERFLARPAAAGAKESHWTPARRLAFLIAVGIGLHNFGEGLAIGSSAASGEISLATVLIIGFALHNATEGFGIVAPLAAAGERASWRFLIGLGLIGGIPTFLGTVVGHSTTSNTMSIAFLTLAAGSIFYVIIQLLGVAQKAGRKDLLIWGVFAGLIAGFLTDMIVTAGGA